MTKKTFLLNFSLVLVVTVLSRSVMMVVVMMMSMMVMMIWVALVVMLVMIYRSHQRRHVEFLF